jgi:hypothetical protein
VSYFYPARLYRWWKAWRAGCDTPKYHPAMCPCLDPETRLRTTSAARQNLKGALPLLSMTLTHHPVRLFRLSCGCLRAYPMMPSTAVHTVLCVSCRREARTETAYPERCCGVTGWALLAGQRIRVACTRPRKSGECRAGSHFDMYLNTGFTTGPLRLTALREGKTGRA